ncbi:HK97 gp10 family phage protein [Mycolicibacterium mageritense]|uniref:HK97 gp10 family phage protein n=1 Tax=Mycolicibacterium mageritense TaxID=53462 RepID=UPI001E444E42|nr:HK97 gp10 family phage protein [Mycolicibacterium mageritense]GJJ22283.1 hypothetical protein MTY414_59560 [Mycolicibacterium mageritense]
MARSSEAEIRAEIERKIRADAEVKVKTEKHAEDVRDYWRGIAPVDSGEYAASVHVEKRKDRDGLPHYWVGTRDWKAHFIEYGTGDDPDDSKSPFGPDTPTPEFAPAAKTAHHFGGTVGDGIGGE